jgi:hypothetical protein
MRSMKRSGTIRQALKEKNALLPILDVATRWNSTLSMLERFLALEPTIRFILEEEASLHDGLRPSEVAQVRCVHIMRYRQMYYTVNWSIVTTGDDRDTHK